MNDSKLVQALGIVIGLLFVAGLVYLFGWKGLLVHPLYWF